MGIKDEQERMAFFSNQLYGGKCTLNNYEIIDGIELCEDWTKHHISDYWTLRHQLDNYVKQGGHLDDEEVQEIVKTIDSVLHNLAYTTTMKLDLERILEE